MAEWHDNDGLLRKYGTDKATANKAGEYTTLGQHRVIEFRLNMTDLADTAAASGIVSDVVFFPDNARIEKIEVVTDTAVTSGGSATLDIGLIATDRSTEIDFDGLVAALAIASFNAAGETVTITAGGTSAGALLGTTTTAPGHIVASYNTAAFTAGVVDVRVYYRPV
jgi:hypothetical protein